MRIDAHQHFWQYNPITQGWINDEMRALRRDFTPKEVQTEIESLNFAGAIAVQAEETLEENFYLNNLADENGFIKGIVGWLDLLDKHAEQKMQDLKSIQKLVGFRTITQGAPDEKYLGNRQYIDNVKLLSSYNYTYDLLVHNTQMKSLIRFTDQLPDNRFILDHLGNPILKINKSKTGNQTTYDDLYPYMEIVAEYFGTDRICFGSDWPVCLVAGSYNTTYSIVEKFCQQVTQTEKEKLFGLNTKEFYKL